MVPVVSSLRGPDTTRLDALIDAIFAFAITLLILWNDRLPNSAESLLALFGSIPSFLVSFGLIAMFWYQHVAWSRRHRVDDRFAMLVSLALAFVVLIYVFPLRIMFSVFFTWATGGFLPTPFMDPVDDHVLDALFITYGLAFASMSGCISLLYWRSWWKRRDFGETVEGAAHAATVGSLFTSFVGVALISVAWAVVCLALDIDNPFLQSLSGWVYFLLLARTFVTGPIARRARDRGLAEGLPAG